MTLHWFQLVGQSVYPPLVAMNVAVQVVGRVDFAWPISWIFRMLRLGYALSS